MGFFRSLIDNSFESFVTVKIAKVVYTIFLIVIALFAFLTVASALVTLTEGDAGTGIALLLFGPLFWLVILVIVRLWLENSIALIKVAENTARETK